jgi:hypothetical protein
LIGAALDGTTTFTNDRSGDTEQANATEMTWPSAVQPSSAVESPAPREGSCS